MRKSKLTLFISAVLVCGLTYTSCEEDENIRGVEASAGEIRVESVEWKSDLKNGIECSVEYFGLNVANRMDIYPGNATNQKQTFESSDQTVARVSEYGQVTPLKLGTTTITVTVDEKSAGFTLTIVEQAEVPVVYVTEIAIPNDAVSVAIGATRSLNTLFTVKPNDATDKSVTYESDDTDIVTVTSAGVITGVAEGTAKITVTSNENNSIKGEFNVTVTPFYGDYEPRNTWTVEDFYPGLFGGEAGLTIIDGMFDDDAGTRLSFVKPGQAHGTGPNIRNLTWAEGGHISFTVDMKATKTVNYFRIQWRDTNNLGMRFSKFQTISGSNNNVDFVEIASNVEITNSGTASVIMSPNVTFPESTYQYIKFYIGNESCFVDFGTNKTVSINELYLGRQAGL